MSRLLGGLKFCPRCKNYKTAKEYGKDKHHRDGLHPHCRVCRRSYRLLRKPIPEIIWHVNTLNPRRYHVPDRMWEKFDELTGMGVDVWVVLPDMSRRVWGELE